MKPIWVIEFCWRNDDWYALVERSYPSRDEARRERDKIKAVHGGNYRIAKYVKEES